MVVQKDPDPWKEWAWKLNLEPSVFFLLPRGSHLTPGAVPHGELPGQLGGGQCAHGVPVPSRVQRGNQPLPGAWARGKKKHFLTLMSLLFTLVGLLLDIFVFV